MEPLFKLLFLKIYDASYIVFDDDDTRGNRFE